MYKVFIDNHCITVDKQLTPEKARDNFLLINEPTEEDIHILVEYLSATPTGIELFMLSENVENLWNTLQNVCPKVLAAGGVIKNSENKTLFIYRNSYWDLPKGKAEKGESMEECALREVAEECGFEVTEIRGKLPLTYHIYFHKKNYVLKETHWFEMFSDYSGPFTPQKEEGIEKVRWFAADEMHIVRENTYRSINGLLDQIT